MLDTAILSLIGENDIPDEGIEAALDDILQSSLWQRRLERLGAQSQQLLKAGLSSRSRLIWNQSTAAQRHGYFLAGVGLTTGHALDAIAAEVNLLLIQANGAILEGDTEAAITAITGLAERVFTFYPFIPDPLPANWRDILRVWLLGQPLSALGGDQPSKVLQFVEGGLIYRLPWAMEAIRVRASANGDEVDVDGLGLEDHELGLAVPAVVTGTVNRSASILIQAGFNSRLAAIKAVTDTGATLATGKELRQWLNADVVAAWSAQADWPTRETRPIWMQFVESFTLSEKHTWADQNYSASITWLTVPPPPGTVVQIHQWAGRSWVLSPDGTPLGTVQSALNSHRSGLLRAQVARDVSKIDILYLGPDDLAGA